MGLAVVVQEQPDAIHYLPIATTVVSAAFLAVLLRHMRRRGRSAHVGWWAAGVCAYGLGTALESAITLFGNSIALTKAWYVAGAVFGGYPLAQGTVWLLCRRAVAWRLTVVSLAYALVMSALVLAAPALPQELEAHRPSGDVLGWPWVRLMSPFLNLYAAIFLVGGAAWSAWRYARQRDPMTAGRAQGNALIAVGALLPGIGGGMAKAGVVEALYVGEFVGILLIWAGYRACVRPAPAASASPA